MLHVSISDFLQDTQKPIKLLRKIWVYTYFSETWFHDNTRDMNTNINTKIIFIKSQLYSKRTLHFIHRAIPQDHLHHHLIIIDFSVLVKKKLKENCGL